jgi:hypothetical protein
MNKLCNLTDDEINKLVDQIIEHEKQDRAEHEKFAVTRQGIIMEDVYDYLKTNNVMIDSEELSYFPNKFFFSYREFEMLADNILEYAMNNNKLIYNELDEKSCGIKYKDMKIIVRIISGQGTSIQMRTDLVNEYWNEDKKFDYKSLT